MITLPVGEGKVMQSKTQQAVEFSGHASAWTAFIGWFVGILPSVATAVTIVWFCILITEKFTGKPFHDLVRCAWSKLFGR